jgi:hypothetical protein
VACTLEFRSFCSSISARVSSSSRLDSANDLTVSLGYNAETNRGFNGVNITIAIMNLV